MWEGLKRVVGAVNEDHSRLIFLCLCSFVYTSKFCCCPAWLPLVPRLSQRPPWDPLPLLPGPNLIVSSRSSRETAGALCCSRCAVKVPSSSMASVTCRGDFHMAASADLLSKPCLDIITSKIQPEPTVTEITEKCVEVNLNLPHISSSPEMDQPRMRRIDPPSSKLPDSPTSTGRTRTSSRPTSAANSIHHSRSGSRSTARSRPPSRQSSFHSTKRAAPNPSIVPVPSPRTSAQEKRESLLAFHRESCRLFQEQSSLSIDEIRPVSSLQRASSTAYRPRRDGRTSSEAGTAPPSPIASSRSSHRFDYEHRVSLSSAATSPPLSPRDRSNTLPNTAPNHVHSPSASSIHIPTTVMEWTSPSTRRREYEKIDRASRGVRGFWRRVAPRWCQRNSRTPFFEEGKSGREGSVRRFRMDLPDDDESRATDLPDHPQAQFLDLFGRERDGDSLRRWAYGRSKTS